MNFSPGFAIMTHNGTENLSQRTRAPQNPATFSTAKWSERRFACSQRNNRCARLTESSFKCRSDGKALAELLGRSIDSNCTRSAFRTSASRCFTSSRLALFHSSAFCAHSSSSLSALSTLSIAQSVAVAASVRSGNSFSRHRLRARGKVEKFRDSKSSIESVEPFKTRVQVVSGRRQT
jgi:hypothetical protein